MISLIKGVLAENKKSFLILIIIFGLSLFLGLVAINFLSAENQTQIQGYGNQIFDLAIDFDLQKNDYSAMGEFKNIWLSFGFLLLLWWLSGYFVFGVVFAYALLAYRGFILGFSISLLLNWDFTYGLIFIILLLLPVHLLILPIFMLAAQKGIVSGFTLGHLKEGISSRILWDFIFYFILFLATAVGAWFQAAIAPWLIQWFIGLI